MKAPVIWQPSGEVIGQAETERGAKGCAGRIPISINERLSATYVKDRLIEPDDPEGEITFEPAWYVSPVLREQRNGRGQR